MSDENISNPAAASEEELAAAVDEALSELDHESVISESDEDLVEVDPIVVLTNDLQRLQADFANYRKRVDRERLVAHEFTTAAVLVELLPILDDLARADQHNELTGGFKAVADRLTAMTEKLGLTSFADISVAFDPNIHEALLHETSSEVTETTVTQVLQPGYRFKDRVIRVARVAVTDPA